MILSGVMQHTESAGLKHGKSFFLRTWSGVSCADLTFHWKFPESTLQSNAVPRSFSGGTQYVNICNSTLALKERTHLGGEGIQEAPLAISLLCRSRNRNCQFHTDCCM